MEHQICDARRAIVDLAGLPSLVENGDRAVAATAHSPTSCAPSNVFLTNGQGAQGICSSCVNSSQPSKFSRGAAALEVEILRAS